MTGGRVAYEKWASVLGAHALVGWEALSKTLKQAWEAAAAEVIRKGRTAKEVTLQGDMVTYADSNNNDDV